MQQLNNSRLQLVFNQHLFFINLPTQKIDNVEIRKFKEENRRKNIVYEIINLECVFLHQEQNMKDNENNKNTIK